MGDWREIGVVGLGRMGGGLALQARERGIKVVGYDAQALRPELAATGVIDVPDLSGLRRELSQPRAIFLYIPAGPAVDELLDQLAPELEPGDVIVDGGDSYWGDSIARHARLATRGLELVDLGTSGGVEGARRGACFVVGGRRQGVERIEAILLELATTGGYVHAGPPGAGHYAKLVHTGIEFGMLQAIAEGIDLLERAPTQLDVNALLSAWRHGSLIRGWLLELMQKAYASEGGLANVPPYVEDTGEVNWLVADALRMEVPIPVIAQAAMQLFASRDDRKHWARAIAMMRHGAGGHPYGPVPKAARERREGQVGGPFRRDSGR